MVLLAHSVSLFLDVNLRLVFAHLTHMLDVSVIDPDNPGIPDGTRQWSLEQRRMGYLNQ